MDATTTKGAKAVAASYAGAVGAAPSSSTRAVAADTVQRTQEPLPAGKAAAGSSTATTTASAIDQEAGCEDEQVERFYALLANIRALRGLHRRGGGDGAGSSTDVTGVQVSGDGRKRARWAEPPWRPAFRMEDFQQAAPPGVAASKKERRDDVDGAS